MSAELKNAPLQTTFADAKAVGLDEKEWEHLTKTLERTPSAEELQMIGVMWSEHCSYKSSKRHLKNLISAGPAVLEGPGENAGLVSVDEKRAVAFKVESHNHPSLVEPFQGAATGVGGILRDIFTMGARPIALGNYLRFGELNSAKQQFLLNGVVAGISHYGNCMGIPTLGGQLQTDACYESNILVNVFALGLVDKVCVFKSNTARANQSIMIWGAKTGRDGIHGASLLASADVQEDKQESKEQKIRVQVGDPFKEKSLLEATLECMEDLGSKVSAIQDMGAAGLTCSTMEIADKSKIGMKINLDAVPVRETGMEAYELLLSESQERMLAIVEEGSEQAFVEKLKKWDCEAAVIGTTTQDEQLRFTYRGEQVVNLPVSRVMDPPLADLPAPQWKEEGAGLFSQTSLEEESTLEDVKEEWLSLKTLLSLPRIASKKVVYERYDSSVGAANIFGPAEAAAALQWIGTKEQPHLGVAFKGACDEGLYKNHPRFGAKYAMAECYRALACVGAKALGITDGMNLGNPKTIEVQTALSEIVKGLNEAIEIFDTPCVSGNVSLYNQTLLGEEKRDIKPSVFVVMVGVVPDVRLAVPDRFQAEGNEAWLIEAPGNTQSLPMGSVYARMFFPQTKMAEQLPYLNLMSEKKLQEALSAGLQAKLFQSCKNVTDGGLAVAIAESCFLEHQCFGFEGDWSKFRQRRDQLLFGESGARVLVEIEPQRRAELMKLGMQWGLKTKRLGTVLKEPIFRIRPLMNGSVKELYESWSGSLSGII